jgi:5-methylcytosine-specific restriction endonuclease McrA
MENIMSNYALVLNEDRQPLNPIHPAAARKLLAQSQAAIFRKFPFTIILKEQSSLEVKPLEIKIDPGSKVTGLAILCGGKLIWAAELTHRGATIKAALLSRRQLRRGRRARKNRYRPARFLNRTRPKGWLAPSLQHRVDTTLTWVKKLMRVAPIQSIAQELVHFDMQQMLNPEISSLEYQQGTLAGYETREYLLEKWDRKCSYCGVENVQLQIEHIIPRAKSGTNRISNLCLACDSCNKKKGTLDVEVFLAKKPDILKRILSQAKRPLKDAAAVNSTRWVLFNALKETSLPVTTGTGGQTKFNRVRLGLEKRHYLDAACVGEVSELKVLTNQPLIIKCQGHGTKQACRTDKFGFPNRYVPRFKFINGFQTGDIVKAVVTKGVKIGTYIGRVAVRSSGSFNISTKDGLIQGISHKYCQIVHAKDGYSYSF